MDEATLERLYARLEKPVYNVVYRWVWNAQVASEIVQETFLRLWRDRAKVQLETVDALVYQMAINRAKNHRRWSRLRSFLGLGEHLVGTEDTEAALLQNERAQRVRSAVEALPERQREVVMLCQFSGMSYREVGEVLGIPEGTVASRRNTALQTMKKRLEVLHG